jgi:hypothetical protein
MSRKRQNFATRPLRQGETLCGMLGNVEGEFAAGGAVRQSEVRQGKAF